MTTQPLRWRISFKNFTLIEFESTLLIRIPSHLWKCKFYAEKGVLKARLYCIWRNVHNSFFIKSQHTGLSRWNSISDFHRDVRSSKKVIRCIMHSILKIFLTVALSILYLNIIFSIYLSIYLLISIHLSIYLSIHPSI